MADACGAYAAIGVVDFILMVATAMLAMAAGTNRWGPIGSNCRASATSEPGVTMSASAVDAEPHSDIYSLGSSTAGDLFGAFGILPLEGREIPERRQSGRR
jgi:hypothetical protein